MRDGDYSKDRGHTAEALNVRLRRVSFYGMETIKDLRKEEGFRKTHIAVISKMD